MCTLSGGTFGLSVRVEGLGLRVEGECLGTPHHAQLAKGKHQES